MATNPSILKQRKAVHKKHCLVTSGATASFPSLINAIYQPAFISTLQQCGYTNLTVQDLGNHTIPPQYLSQEGGIRIESVSLFLGSLEAEVCKLITAQDKENDSEGLVISHAGTGSLLECFRARAPVISVPNKALMDNHQEELAMKFAQAGLCLCSQAVTEDLCKSVNDMETWRRDHKSPIDNLNVFQQDSQRDAYSRATGFWAVINEEAGFSNKDL